MPQGFLLPPWRSFIPRMRWASLVIVVAAELMSMLAQGEEVSLFTSAGEPFALADLNQGRWALAFVVANCPACTRVISWLDQALPKFPGIRFVHLGLPRSFCSKAEAFSFLWIKGGVSAAFWA